MSESYIVYRQNLALHYFIHAFILSPASLLQFQISVPTKAHISPWLLKLVFPKVFQFKNSELE